MDPFDESYLKSSDPGQDINKISYNLFVGRGEVDIMEIVLGAPSGLARIQFENFAASFIPDAVSSRLNEAGEEVEIHQTEIQVVVDRFSLAELQPSRLKHPAYTTLLSKDTPTLSTSTAATSTATLTTTTTNDVDDDAGKEEDLTAAPYMRLKYIQHQEPRKTRQNSVYYSTKEVNLQFNGVRLVFDRDVWKRLQSFFTEGPRAKLLEKAVEEGLDAVVESMLYDYVKFKVEAVGCSVVLPPFAGHKGPHHIASIVLLIHADR